MSLAESVRAEKLSLLWVAVARTVTHWARKAEAMVVDMKEAVETTVVRATAMVAILAQMMPLVLVRAGWGRRPAWLLVEAMVEMMRGASVEARMELGQVPTALTWLMKAGVVGGGVKEEIAMARSGVVVAMWGGGARGVVQRVVANALEQLVVAVTEQTAVGPQVAVGMESGTLEAGTKLVMEEEMMALEVRALPTAAMVATVKAAVKMVVTVAMEAALTVVAMVSVTGAVTVVVMVVVKVAVEAAVKGASSVMEAAVLTSVASGEE